MATISINQIQLLWIFFKYRIFLNTSEEIENQRGNTTRKQSRRKMNTNKRRTQVCSLLCPLIFWAPLLEYTYFSLCKNRKQSKMWFYLIYLITNLCALLSTREYWIKPLRHAWPFHSQDLIRNSPYCLLYSSCGVSSENLVLDQLIIPWLIFSVFLSLAYLIILKQSQYF